MTPWDDAADMKNSMHWTAVILLGVAVAASAQEPGAGAAAASAPAASMPVVADSAIGGMTGGALANLVPRAGATHATFFILRRVDGEDVRTSLDESRAASAGLGRRMRVVPKERAVKAGKATVKLLARVAYGAPLDEIFAGSQLYSAEGETEVELRAGVRYRVNGVLDTYRREVWLEEEATGRVVGKKISQSPNPELIAEMASADRYTCCNIRYDDRWVSDSNFLDKPFIPAGARVKVTGWARGRVNVNVEGRPLAAGPDYGHESLTREQFADRLFVREDPRQRFATYPQEVQDAVLAGKVMRGMTREQVLMSIGYPRPDHTAGLAAPRWVYFTADPDEFDLDFDAEGKVVAINASSRIKKTVVHSP